MDVEIIKKDGTSFLLSDYDIIVRDFRVQSPEILPVYGDIDGRSGTVNYGATLGRREIVVPFYLDANDLHDVALLRDKLFELVIDVNPFYVRELRRDVYQTGDNKYVGGKRYKVRISNTFDVEQMFTYGFGELVFETTDLPYAESLGTTQDIHNKGINADDELWGFGMGLQVTEDTLKYTYNASSSSPFRVFNAGNVPVHPFEQDFKMTILNVQGSTEMFQITNLTNGSRSRITVPLSTTDVVVYDGPNVTRNGLAFLGDTRKDFIELSPGWNNFRIYYCESADIEFDFRFYYL